MTYSTNIPSVILQSRACHDTYEMRDHKSRCDDDYRAQLARQGVEHTPNYTDDCAFSGGLSKPLVLPDFEF